MFSFRRITLAVIAPLFVAVSTQAVAETPEFSETPIEELHAWIDSAADLPRTKKSVSILFAEPHEVTGISKMAAGIGNVPRGLYDPIGGEITLFLPWSASNPQDVSVLLHELVHHRQNGRHYYCQAAKEQDAYYLQRDWLAERDLTLDVNWVAVLLASSCTPRDIHP